LGNQFDILRFSTSVALGTIEDPDEKAVGDEVTGVHFQWTLSTGKQKKSESHSLSCDLFPHLHH
jgi:hypothetical protein